MITIQNPYSLLNRLFEVGLAEISHRENVGLLPYSPLGFGVLSGKYLGGKRPENGRVTLYPNYSRYIGATASQATQAYFVCTKAWFIFDSNGSDLLLALKNLFVVPL